MNHAETLIIFQRRMKTLVSLIKAHTERKETLQAKSNVSKAHGVVNFARELDIIDDYALGKWLTELSAIQLPS